MVGVVGEADVEGRPEGEISLIGIDKQMISSSVQPSGKGSNSSSSIPAGHIDDLGTVQHRHQFDGMYS